MPTRYDYSRQDVATDNIDSDDEYIKKMNLESKHFNSKEQGKFWFEMYRCVKQGKPMVHMQELNIAADDPNYQSKVLEGLRKEFNQTGTMIIEELVECQKSLKGEYLLNVINKIIAIIKQTEQSGFHAQGSYSLVCKELIMIFKTLLKQLQTTQKSYYKLKRQSMD